MARHVMGSSHRVSDHINRTDHDRGRHPMKCGRCKHPLAAHYPDGCFTSMWGGPLCPCRAFVWPKRKDIANAKRA